MESYLTLLAAARSPHPSFTPSAGSPAPADGCAYKLSTRHHLRHRKRHNAVANALGADPSSLRSQTQQTRHSAHDTFRSVAVLGEVVRLETDANQSKLQPEDAAALLRRILSPADVAPGDDDEALSLSELLSGIDAACWQTLAASEHPPSEELASELASPRSARCQSHKAQWASEQSELTLASPAPVRLRFSQLYRGVHAAICDKQRVLTALQTTLQQATKRNNELPGVISGREAAIRALKEAYMASAVKKLDCESPKPAQSRKNTSEMAVAVDDKVEMLRRRRDLRVWACNELRSAINDHTTRASELKKEISALVTDIKREEIAHKLKAKRVEAIMASNNAHRLAAAAALQSAAAAGTAQGGERLPPEDMVQQAHEKKTTLLDEIEQRKAHLRARTEDVFNARNEVGALEQQRSEVGAKIAVLQHEIGHIQRSCTPRPDWTALLSAAQVTTAIDRAGKKAKLRMESSRKKLLGSGGSKQDESDDVEESGERRLKQILTSNWSTIDKVRAMSEELTRIRTKYHAGDAIAVEQAKLDHLQREIAKALQQLEAIKAKAVE